MDTPLSKHLHFHVKDPNQACSELAKEYVEHELHMKNAGEQLNATHNQVSFSGVSLHFLEYGAEVTISASIDDFYLIQIPLTGSTWVESDEECGLSDVDVAFVSPYQRKMTQQWSADSKQIHVKIDRSILEHKLNKLIEIPVTDPVNFELLMPMENPKAASWCRFIHYLVEEFDNNDSLMIAGPSVQHTVSTIITNLLYAQPHNYSDALNGYKHAVIPACVKRAQQYIQDNLVSKISMEDLVNATGTNERSLFENFRKFKQMTPMTYLRMLRLEHVRRELISPQDHIGVTEIAMKWGFTQLGRFASTYKSIYGELPSETLKCNI